MIVGATVVSEAVDYDGGGDVHGGDAWRRRKEEEGKSGKRRRWMKGRKSLRNQAREERMGIFLSDWDGERTP